MFLKGSLKHAASYQHASIPTIACDALYKMAIMYTSKFL